MPKFGSSLAGGKGVFGAHWLAWVDVGAVAVGDTAVGVLYAVMENLVEVRSFAGLPGGASWWVAWSKAIWISSKRKDFFPDDLIIFPKMRVNGLSRDASASRGAKRFEGGDARCRLEDVFVGDCPSRDMHAAYLPIVFEGGLHYVNARLGVVLARKDNPSSSDGGYGKFEKGDLVVFG